ncbi:MAG: signal peptidase II, partial [Magnetococcales bacterium]|nr:signal peptidase II [Magnetococcales bacterium]
MLRLGLILAVVVLVLDQASKLMASAWLQYESVTLIPGFFDLVLVHNVGAAFGLFTDMGETARAVLLIGVAVAAIALIIHLLRQENTLWGAVSLGLVLGGAIGNMIDRIRIGLVVDFIHLHWQTLSWPVFNIADSAITVGIGMLLILEPTAERNRTLALLPKTEKGPEKIPAQALTIDLRGRNFRYAHFDNTQIYYPDFTGADLTEASLNEAKLHTALLKKSVLTNASLRYARLQGAEMSDAQLQGADMTSAQLQ